ncbi:uncharacterized protein LOC125419681 isoform X1 [Ziziphus jujuba]|uniref:Uncharacterized protein LOC125419681 isoform X1 n=1 Tax=Ziziphus jujuba TaxID=326968 RepID=A0ABM3ZXK5_ZIZJJ|nr:uncharacterized protein LOC125419681 isoform X1 [Ziziphus jujuba]XP_060669209.1 uncharacterized protein LOC125419681 isoform X1 [Ziziphus jujuba]
MEDQGQWGHAIEWKTKGIKMLEQAGELFEIALGETGNDDKSVRVEDGGSVTGVGDRADVGCLNIKGKELGTGIETGFGGEETDGSESESHVAVLTGKGSELVYIHGPEIEIPFMSGSGGGSRVLTGKGNKTTYAHPLTAETLVSGGGNMDVTRKRAGIKHGREKKRKTKGKTREYWRKAMEKSYYALQTEIQSVKTTRQSIYAALVVGQGLLGTLTSKTTNPISNETFRSFQWVCVMSAVLIHFYLIENSITFFEMSSEQSRLYKEYVKHFGYGKLGEIGRNVHPTKKWIYWEVCMRMGEFLLIISQSLQ